ncbi:MAG: hypothetical protein KKB37_00040, partial [Alphaproteobacteria bacterium]|nr:hypothetical protein [Alphaproteobacteria bacterium]
PAADGVLQQLQVLTPRIAHGEFKRPPPDLGMRRRNGADTRQAGELEIRQGPPPLPVDGPTSAAVSELPQPRTAEAGCAQNLPDTHIASGGDEPAVLPARDAEADDANAGLPDDVGARPGDEAEVIIIARPRSTPNDAHATGALAARDRTKTRALAAGRRRVDRRGEDRGRLGAKSADVDAAVEEATVTIIRAAATERDAASILPNAVANDQVEVQTGRKGMRRIGARFLKALTGD